MSAGGDSLGFLNDLPTQEYAYLRHCLLALDEIDRLMQLEVGSTEAKKQEYRRARSTSRLRSKLLTNQTITRRFFDRMIREGLVTRIDARGFNYYDCTEKGTRVRKELKADLNKLATTSRLLRNGNQTTSRQL